MPVQGDAPASVSLPYAAPALPLAVPLYSRRLSATADLLTARGDLVHALDAHVGLLSAAAPFAVQVWGRLHAAAAALEKAERERLAAADDAEPRSPVSGIGLALRSTASSPASPSSPSSPSSPTSLTYLDNTTADLLLLLLLSLLLLHHRDAALAYARWTASWVQPLVAVGAAAGQLASSRQRLLEDILTLGAQVTDQCADVEEAEGAEGMGALENAAEAGLDGSRSSLGDVGAGYGQVGVHGSLNVSNNSFNTSRQMMSPGKPLISGLSRNPDFGDFPIPERSRARSTSSFLRTVSFSVLAHDIAANAPSAAHAGPTPSPSSGSGPASTASWGGVSSPNTPSKAVGAGAGPKPALPPSPSTRLAHSQSHSHAPSLTHARNKESSADGNAGAVASSVSGSLGSSRAKSSAGPDASLPPPLSRDGSLPASSISSLSALSAEGSLSRDSSDGSARDKDGGALPEGMSRGHSSTWTPSSRHPMSKVALIDDERDRRSDSGSDSEEDSEAVLYNPFVSSEASSAAGSAAPPAPRALTQGEAVQYLLDLLPVDLVAMDDHDLGQEWYDLRVPQTTADSLNEAYRHMCSRLLAMAARHQLYVEKRRLCEELRALCALDEDGETMMEMYGFQ
jgi:hypothetical protein